MFSMTSVAETGDIGWRRTRMSADMFAQVDKVCRDPNGTKGRLDDRVRVSTERQDRPVVVRIHGVV